MGHRLIGGGACLFNVKLTMPSGGTDERAGISLVPIQSLEQPGLLDRDEVFGAVGGPADVVGVLDHLDFDGRREVARVRKERDERAVALDDLTVDEDASDSVIDLSIEDPEIGDTIERIMAGRMADSE